MRSWVRRVAAPSSPAGALVLALVLVLTGCSGSSDDSSTSATSTAPTTTTIPASTVPVPASLPKTVQVGRVTFHVPEAWAVDGGPPTAYVGILAGGRADVALRVETDFGGPIDSLVPTMCLGSPPSAPKRVDLVESGFAPVGDRTAEFRFWKAACPGGDGGDPEEHRAWVLPVSRIAIVEQRHEPELVDVVTYAEVRP